jgi:hypothetical protein
LKTYTGSNGKAVPIADMNPYHLHNAIKKLAGVKDPEDVEQHTATLSALRAEQESRGGPPEDAK